MFTLRKSEYIRQEKRWISWKRRTKTNLKSQLHVLKTFFDSKNVFLGLVMGFRMKQLGRSEATVGLWSVNSQRRKKIFKLTRCRVQYESGGVALRSQRSLSRRFVLVPLPGKRIGILTYDTINRWNQFCLVWRSTTIEVLDKQQGFTKVAEECLSDKARMENSRRSSTTKGPHTRIFLVGQTKVVNRLLYWVLQNQAKVHGATSIEHGSSKTKKSEVFLLESITLRETWAVWWKYNIPGKMRFLQLALVYQSWRQLHAEIGCVD